MAQGRTMPIQMNQYAFGHAAQTIETAQGPRAIKNRLEKSTLSPYLQWTPELTALDDTRQAKALGQTVALCEKLAQYTHQAVKQQQFFMTLGGDHSCALGTWSGAAGALGANEALGLIWIDAHMDSHTMTSSATKNIHGMPLSALLGHGESALTQLFSTQTKLQPENVVLIGIRSYEPAEAELLNTLGVTIFDMNVIDQLSIEAVIKKAIEQTTKNTHAFGLTLDLDAIDPTDAPGTGTPVDHGILASDLLATLPLIANHPNFIGAELAEFNPVLDVNNTTELLSIKLIECLLRPQLKLQSDHT